MAPPESVRDTHRKLPIHHFKNAAQLKTLACPHASFPAMSLASREDLIEEASLGLEVWGSPGPTGVTYPEAG